MGRDITANFATVLAQDELRIGILAEFDFSGGFARYFSGVDNLFWNTHTWVAVGALGNMSKIEEASGTQAPGVQFDLNGIPTALLTVALVDTYQGRSAKAWIALFDTSDVLIADPALVFSGFMDVIQITGSGDTRTISVLCEGRNITMNRNREIRYTHQEQERLFPGDTGLQHVASIQGKEIAWGERTVHPNTPRDRDAGYWGDSHRDKLP